MSEVERRGLSLRHLLSILVSEARKIGIEQVEWFINQFYPAATARSLCWAVEVFFRAENGEGI